MALKYSITVGDVYELYKKTACDACGEEFQKDKGHGRHIDHDHRTGQVRGLLHFHCNAALGQVRDDVKKLQSLIDYLKRFEQTDILK